MTIKSSAVRGILDCIKESHASDILFQARSSKELIRILYEQGILRDTDLDRVFKEAIVNEAKTAVEYMRKTRRYADHSLCSPEYLSYAIQRDRLSKRELRIVKRNLDHEKDLDTFCQHYDSNGLPVRLTNEFLKLE